MLNVVPWHCIPLPYVLVWNGPCRTCTPWLMTLPLDDALGAAVALTPPTSPDLAGRQRLNDSNP